MGGRLRRSDKAAGSSGSRAGGGVDGRRSKYHCTSGRCSTRGLRIPAPATPAMGHFGTGEVVSKFGGHIRSYGWVHIKNYLCMADGVRHPLLSETYFVLVMHTEPQDNPLLYKITKC